MILITRGSEHLAVFITQKSVLQLFLPKFPETAVAAMLIYYNKAIISNIESFFKKSI